MEHEYKARQKAGISERRHTQAAWYKKKYPIMALLHRIDYSDGVILQMAEGWTAGW